jgi:hypothetical protein
MQSESLYLLALQERNPPAVTGLNSVIVHEAQVKSITCWNAIWVLFERKLSIGNKQWSRTKSNTSTCIIVILLIWSWDYCITLCWPQIPCMTYSRKVPRIVIWQKRLGFRQSRDWNCLRISQGTLRELASSLPRPGQWMRDLSKEFPKYLVLWFVFLSVSDHLYISHGPTFRRLESQHLRLARVWVNKDK